MTTSTTAPALARRLRSRLNDTISAADKLAAQGEARSLTVDEVADLAGYLDDIDRLGASLRTVEPPAPAPAAPASVRVRKEPFTYRPDGEHSYFRDLLDAKVHRLNGAEAQQRLDRHRAEMQGEYGGRDVLARAALRRANVEWRTNPNRTAGQGGNFAPPAWLIDRYATVPRAGRPLANLAPSLPLPGGVQSVSIPKVTTGEAVTEQTVDAAAISSTDIVDAALTSTVRTIEGSSVISLQLLEQSGGPGIDEVLYRDLLAAYDAELEAQAWYGSGSNGQLKGVMNVSGIGAVTYTDATPTVPEFLPFMAQAAANVGNNRKQPVQAVFMAPRRWYWLSGSLDGNNRPFAAPGDGEFAEDGMPIDADKAHGPVLGGVPVYLSPPLLNAASDTTEAVVVGNPSDLLLLEGVENVNVFQDVLAGTLQCRLVFHRFVAYFADRYPTAWCSITGTGMASPSGF